MERTLTIDGAAVAQGGRGDRGDEPVGGADIAGYAAEGLPSGLEIDGSTGAITGTPDAADANTSTATVTVGDTAGNTAEVEITFPVVSKGEQTLIGFRYSPTSVTFNTATPTLTAPSGAVGDLSYAADPTSVCTVNPATGELTIVGVGACIVTVTAAATDHYNEATDLFEITISATGTIVLNLDDIADDDTVNIAEKAAGFTITGDTGSEDGVDVSVQIGSETPLTTVSADNGNSTAAWSVDVPGDAAYITGSSVTVTVSASKTGFTDPSDVQRTLAVDLTAPTAPSYTAPTSLKVGEAIAAMNPSGGADIAGYAAEGLPSGLEIDGSTGAITGTPDAADANTSTATVTVSDTAGNTAEVDIAFPAVAKGEQTLTGFRYAAASMTLGTTAPTVAAPSGAETPVSYTAEPATVCSVDDSTGALTVLAAGACVITARAEASDDYEQGVATFTVTVQSAGSLVLNLDDIAGDNTVNVAEHRAGFTIAGDTGAEAGVGVTVQIGSETPLTTTSSDNGNGTAAWTVDVPGDAGYITGDSVEVTVSASKTGFTDPADVVHTLAIDLTAPTAPTYTEPTSLKVGSMIVDISPVGGSGIDFYSATGFPSGLVINPSTGVISGTPAEAAASASASITVSDNAGNTATTPIAFPVVDKGDQTLNGFRYSASSSIFGNAAPTVTEPRGAQTPIRYTAAPSTVCTVDATKGALTLVAAGSCVITATAQSSPNYNEASASATVTVRLVFATGNAGPRLLGDGAGERRGSHRNGDRHAGWRASDD